MPAIEPRAKDEGERSDLPPPCAKVREHLYVHAEGENLPARDLAALEAHLGECEACAAEFRTAGKFTTEISRLLGALRPSGKMRRKVLETIEPRGGSRRPWAGVAALAAALAAGLVLLAVAGERPAARIEDPSGSVAVLAFSGAEWRIRPGAREVRPGDRVELRAHGRVLLALREGKLHLDGPALVQLERGREGATVVHVLREARASLDVAGGKGLEIRIGGARLVAREARLTLNVEPTGACELRVLSGRVAAYDGDSERAIVAGAGRTLKLDAGR